MHIGKKQVENDGLTEVRTQEPVSREDETVRNLGEDYWWEGSYIEIFNKLWKAWDFTPAPYSYIHLPQVYGYTRRLLGQRQRTVHYSENCLSEIWGPRRIELNKVKIKFINSKFSVVPTNNWLSNAKIVEKNFLFIVPWYKII